MNENSQPTHCVCCGQSLKKFWHSLTPGLVNTLIEFKRIAVKQNNKVHLLKDTGFDVSKTNNFQKLRYFAAVHHVLNDKGKRIPGMWLLTSHGNSFLQGEIRLPSKVLTFNNKIEQRSNTLVSVYDVLESNELPYFETDFKYESLLPSYGDIETPMFDEDGRGILFL